MSPNAFRPRAVVLGCACALAAVVAPAAAQAQPVHQVVAGESLWQIAAANGLSATQLAAANGLSPDAAVRTGQVVTIPAGGGPAAPSTPTDVVASPAPAPAASTGASGAGSAGGVVVQPGDTLSAIAARAGVSVTRLAASNGVTTSALLPAGRRLALPAPGSSAAAPTSGASTATASSTTTTSTTTSTSGAQVAAPGATGAAPSSGVRVSGTQIGSTATANGVPSALARAIAWQESGFNNGAVSSVGARGVMQVMPGTWTWIDRNLASRPLDPSSAADNVRAGTLYLQHLLRETGGDQDLAAAAYYQGLSSVRRRGMYDDTKQYVQSVRALRSRFGG